MPARSFGATLPIPLTSYTPFGDRDCNPALIGFKHGQRDQLKASGPDPALNGRIRFFSVPRASPGPQPVHSVRSRVFTIFSLGAYPLFGDNSGYCAGGTRSTEERVPFLKPEYGKLATE
jgi:hypothetical protein